MFLALAYLSVQCLSILVSWPRVGVLSPGIALVWHSIADRWKLSGDSLAIKDIVMRARGENGML